MLRVRPVSHPHRSSKLAEQGLSEKQVSGRQFKLLLHLTTCFMYLTDTTSDGRKNVSECISTSELLQLSLMDGLSTIGRYLPTSLTQTGGFSKTKHTVHILFSKSGHCNCQNPY